MSSIGKQSKQSTRGSARAAAVDPQLRKLQVVHEVFAQGLATALSALLQTELHARVGAVGLVGAGELQRSLRSPDCIIALRLHPRTDRMLLLISASTALALLELLLGGSEGVTPAPRALTEIEWSLLEEVVRVILRPLAESWRAFAEIEFEVESLGSDPTVVQFPQGSGPLVRIPVDLLWAGRAGIITIAVAEELFDGAPPRTDLPEQNSQESDRNFRLIEDATVEMEVVLRGPTLPFEQVMALTAGQVVTFNYPVERNVEACFNGEVWMAGHVVSSGRKRAFQVDRLP
ncbi:MAG TPA: FliM/FliN family flagellar motor switch protein [Bryobacteraceae bacterium]|jgi:flagellar motor switch protein FliM